MALALPELPEEIQRKIVVSLPPKAFARSSVLSKSWLSFYNSTRCSFNLDFKIDADRVPEALPQEIVNFDKSLSASQLREKLTVDEFNINMELSRNLKLQHYSDKLTGLVYKWLAALFTTNNILKVLQIKIQTPRIIGKFYMPPEIFSNESLQVLHLHLGRNWRLDSVNPRNCILDGVHPKNLGCLRVLSLRNIFIDGKSTNRLLTACPILEELTWVNHVRGQHLRIKGFHKLKTLHIYGLEDVRIQEAPALENVSLMACNYGDRIIINSHLCRRINILHMIVNSDRTTARHIQHIVSCLPALEMLCLSMWYATDIRISSLCLKNLQLNIRKDPYLTMVKIDAPNLRCYNYVSYFSKFARQLMMKTGMLERVVINLMNIQIDEPGDVLELRKALRMIEHLKLGVDTVKLGVDSVKLDHLNQIYYRPMVRVEASRLDEKLNVSATRVIEMLDAGAVKFDVDGKFCL